jgi:hypothetical protein
LISFIQVRNVGQTNENISGSGGEDRKNEREKSFNPYVFNFDI